MSTPDGLLIVDKPAGWTSHDVVAKCRGLCQTRKGGHAGTLDPMATGVLVLGVGRATRLLGHLALTDKAYEATIRLGQSTVTDDAEGDTVSETDASHIDTSMIMAATATLTGEIEQVPSSVSAVKVGGRRAYKRVRAGEDVELPTRRVLVSEFAVDAVRRTACHVDVDVRVECSTGTYVRALARDLGAALEVGGHLTALRRTRVGPFTLDRARTLAQLEQALDIVSLDEAAAASFPVYVADEDEIPLVRNGRALPADLGVVDSPVAVLTEAGQFLALYSQAGQLAKAVAVFDPA
jgi:tRNA pseudouridine55 synthase